MGQYIQAAALALGFSSETRFTTSLADAPPTRPGGKSVANRFEGMPSCFADLANARINIGEKDGGDDETRTRDFCRDGA
jgi:hypothetical protein